MTHQLPFLGRANTGYLTEEQALLQVENLRHLYTGLGFSEVQQNQLELKIQHGITGIKTIFFRHSFDFENVQEQHEARTRIQETRSDINQAIEQYQAGGVQTTVVASSSSSALASPPTWGQPPVTSRSGIHTREYFLNEYDRISRNMAIHSSSNPSAGYHVLEVARQVRTRVAALPIRQLAAFVEHMEEQARQRRQAQAQNPNVTLHSLGHGGRESHFSYLTSRSAAHYFGR